MKRLLLTTLAASLAATLCLAAGAAFADDDDDRRERRGRGPVLELYSEPNFAGERRLFFADDANFLNIGFNDRARSARARGDWQLCDHVNFGGTCRRIAGDVRNLEEVGLAWRVSSARLVPQDWDGGGGGAGASLTLFEGEGLDGRAVRLDGPEGDLRRQGFNDAARSLRARGAWVVCANIAYGGECRTVRGEVFDLRAIGLTGAISSARPLEAGGGYDGGGPGGGYGGGYGGGAWGRDTPAAEGRTAAFFPRPRRGAEPLPACDNAGGGGRGCAQVTADRFCRAQGYRTAAYFTVGFARRFEVLEDVLCAR